MTEKHNASILLFTLALFLCITLVIGALYLFNNTITGKTIMEVRETPTILAILGQSSTQASHFFAYTYNQNNSLDILLQPTAENPLALYPAGQGITIELIDLTRDGIDELLIAQTSGGAQLTAFSLENNTLHAIGSTTLTSLTPEGQDHDVIGASLTTGNLHGFDTPVIIAGQHSSTTETKPLYLVVYEWNGNLQPQHALYSGFTTPETPGIAVELGNLLDTSSDQLIIGQTFGSQGTALRIINAEGTELLSHTEIFTDGNGISIASGDFGGPKELLAVAQGPGGSTTNVKFFELILDESSGTTALVLIAEQTIGEPGDGAYIDTVDINGDGIDELLVGQGSNGQYITIYEVSSDGSLAPLATQQVTAQESQGMLVTGGILPITYLSETNMSINETTNMTLNDTTMSTANNQTNMTAETNQTSIPANETITYNETILNTTQTNETEYSTNETLEAEENTQTNDTQTTHTTEETQENPPDNTTLEEPSPELSE